MVLVLAIVLVACEGGPVDPADSLGQPKESEEVEYNLMVNSMSISIWRFIDKQAGVVCWAYSGIEKGGIDCMPLLDTELDR
jgi:hypothetical protein